MAKIRLFLSAFRCQQLHIPSPLSPNLSETLFSSFNDLNFLAQEKAQQKHL